MRRTWIIGPAVALTLGGCLDKAGSAKVDAATARVFTLMKAQQYDVMYDEAAPELSTAHPGKAAFVAQMQAIDAAYGACEAPTKAMSLNVVSKSTGYFHTQGYNQRCAKGPREFQLTIVLRQGRAQLAGLHAGPPASDD